MGSRRKRPTAAERRADDERRAEIARAQDAERREEMLREMVGDLAIADLLLDRVRGLSEPNRGARRGEETVIRAMFACAVERVHRAAEAVRFLLPPAPPSA